MLDTSATLSPYPHYYHFLLTWEIDMDETLSCLAKDESLIQRRQRSHHQRSYYSLHWLCWFLEEGAMGGIGVGVGECQCFFFTWLSSSWLDLVIANVKWHPITHMMGLEGCQQATTSTRQLEHFPGSRTRWKPAETMTLWPFDVILPNERNDPPPTTTTTLRYLYNRTIIYLLLNLKNELTSDGSS